MNIKLPLCVAALGLAAVFSSASATPVADNYNGGAGHGYGDVIADPGVRIFDISSIDASVSGNHLTVTVYTNFAGHAGVDPQWTAHHAGIGYGDLFLSNGWTPYGSAAPYNSDNAANGNHWTYAFSLDGPLSNSGGNGTIYKLGDGTAANHNPDVLLTQHFMDCAGRCIYRDGQAVAVDKSKATTTHDAGTWTVGDGFLSFSFDIAGLGLDPGNLGLHWTMYCGNDVIEGLDPATPVPEPGSAGTFLLGLGLIGVGILRRRKAARAA